MMKHLKTSIHDLRQIFDRSITVRHIAEPFISFDAQLKSVEVQAFMKAKDFDIVGVRKNGSVVGYVCGSDLVTETIETHVKSIDEQLLVNDWTPLLTILQQLTKSPYVFVVVMGEPIGIVVKGDLQKAPVRMWLFGLISLLEMQFLRLIRIAYPDETWKDLLNEGRLNKSKRTFQERMKGNEAIDLADCLQFSDKRTIILKNEILCEALSLKSKKNGTKLLKSFEKLRNSLAHSQDIITGNWPQLVDLAQNAEKLIALCEEISPITYRSML